MTSPGAIAKLVHTVFRRLTLPLEQSILFPLKTFSRQSDAQAYALEKTQAYMGLLDCRLMKPTPTGLNDVGLSLREVLADIGIANIGHNMGQIEVTDSLIVVAPQPDIIVPSNSKH